jgi:hypothetical protein
MAAPTIQLMDEYLGASIQDICPNGYHTIGAGHNHCAHFVAHVLSYDFGRTCHLMAARSRRLGRAATLTVKDIFDRSPNKFLVTSCGPFPRPGIVYVTMRSNLNVDTMSLGSSLTRHVGVGIGSHVWHFSNSRNRVVKQPGSEFLSHYSGDTVMVYGDLVPCTNPVPYGRCVQEVLECRP